MKALNKVNMSDRKSYETKQEISRNNVDFDITIKEIYNLEPPVIDDAFASSLGMNGLKVLIRKEK